MTALLIIALVILFAVYMSLIPIRLSVGIKYNNDGLKSDFAFYYGFIRIKARKSKNNDDGEESDKKNKKKRKNKEEDNGQAYSPAEVCKFMRGRKRIIGKLVYEILKYFFTKGIRIRSLDINLVLGANDAMETALAYGASNAFIYNIAGLIDRYMRLDSHNIKIKPDFRNQCILADIKVIINTHIFKLLPLAVLALKGGKGLIKEFKKGDWKN